MSELLNSDGNWNRALLQEHFYQPDIDWILQIKASKRLEADFIVWYPNKMGCFWVRSASYLGLQEQMAAHDSGASSVRPDGRRPAWDLVWKNDAPAKVRIFAWKAACEALATESTQKQRHLATDNTCTLCGTVEESVHHALIICPHAAALWDAMRETWELPTPEDLHDTEQEWLFRLLDKISETQKLATLMIMWRIWFA